MVRFYHQETTALLMLLGFAGCFDGGGGVVWHIADWGTC
jgi:hypothetical protein